MEAIAVETAAWNPGLEGGGPEGLNAWFIKFGLSENGGGGPGGGMNAGTGG